MISSAPLTMGLIRHISDSAERTQEIGRELGQTLPANSVVTLQGELGAGKTTFVRGLVQGAAKGDLREVCSPTFSLLNIYQGETDVFHFDLYRLPRENEFITAGFDEYFSAGGICCIEWAEKIENLLPKNCISVTLDYLGNNIRELIIKGNLQNSGFVDKH